MNHAHFNDLVPKMCRWPLWAHDGKCTHEYCGHRTKGSDVYCRKHMAIAYRDYVRPLGKTLGNIDHSVTRISHGE